MAFIWAYSMSADNKIKQNGVQEIRDNADWLKDNLICQSHNSVDNVTHDASANPTHKAIHNATYDNSQDVTYHPGHLDSAKSSAESAARSAEDLVAYSKNDSGYYYGDLAHSVDCPTNYATDLTVAYGAVKHVYDSADLGINLGVDLVKGG
jgi:hypothetical protein